MNGAFFDPDDLREDIDLEAKLAAGRDGKGALPGDIWDSFRELTENDRVALATAQIEGFVTNARLRQISRLHPRDITFLLKKMVENGTLLADGKGRGTTYRVSGLPPIDLASEGKNQSSAHSNQEIKQNLDSPLQSDPDTRQKRISSAHSSQDSKLNPICSAQLASDSKQKRISSAQSTQSTKQNCISSEGKTSKTSQIPVSSEGKAPEALKIPISSEGITNKSSQNPTSSEGSKSNFVNVGGSPLHLEGSPLHLDDENYDPCKAPELISIADPVRTKGKVEYEIIHKTILNLCDGRFLSIQQLSSLLNRSQEGLRNRFIKPMIDECLLERRFPQQPSHGRQGYRTRNGERGTRNGERGMRNGECGMRNGERGMRNGECGMRNGECGIKNDKL